MIFRNPREDEKGLYERLAQHPLQSWAWGDFRSQTGVETERLIGFEGTEAVSQIQVTFHHLPKLPYTIGYYPKGTWPDEIQLEALRDLAERKNALFIKLEPDISCPPKNQADVDGLRHSLLTNGCVEGRPLFTQYSFLIDLTQTEEQLLETMKSKTRYNIRVAEKHGVEVTFDTSDETFDHYLRLLKETTSRQGFYAHTESYQRKMWAVLKSAHIATLAKAMYQGEVIVVWVLFLYKNRLYYPYGASSRKYREAMASNLVMWKAIQWGKSQRATSFDLWGALGPNPDPKDPWFGFHNFKLGFGGALAEFVGSYDLVTQPRLYRLFRRADQWRWRWLRFRARLPF